MDVSNTRRGDGEHSKRVLILASKLGYQTRGFADAAEKLGVGVRFGTDRCHKLDDPWGDAALALHFENPREAAQEIVRAFNAGVAGEKAVDAVLALGDRPTETAAYAAEALGIAGNPPAAAENCRSKLRQRETLRAARVRVPDFFSSRASGRVCIFSITSPSAKAMLCTPPSRHTVISSRDESALVTDTPTPCKPPENA